MNFSVPDIPAVAAILPPLPQPLLDVLSSVSVSWKQLVVPGVLSYLALCRALRFRREHAMRRKMGFADRASLARMTTREAQEIIYFLASWEFPLFNFMALQFGLFKVSRDVARRSKKFQICSFW